MTSAARHRDQVRSSIELRRELAVERHLILASSREPGGWYRSLLVKYQGIAQAYESLEVRAEAVQAFGCMTSLSRPTELRSHCKDWGSLHYSDAARPCRVARFSAPGDLTVVAHAPAHIGKSCWRKRRGMLAVLCNTTGVCFAVTPNQLC